MALISRDFFRAERFHGRDASMAFG